MDRREFGRLVVGAGAATAASEATDALGQTPATSRSMQRMTPAASSDVLNLPPELRPVLEQSHPRFSDAEYVRRHNALARVMEAAGVDHLLIVSAQNVGNATRWVTSWPGTTEALLVFRPGEQMTMFVEYYNHVPQARMLARGVDVRWGEEKGIVKVGEELGRRERSSPAATPSASASSGRSAARGGNRSKASSSLSAWTANTSSCAATSRTRRSRGCAWARRSAMPAWRRSSAAPGRA